MSCRVRKGRLRGGSTPPACTTHVRGVLGIYLLSMAARKDEKCCALPANDAQCDICRRRFRHGSPTMAVSVQFRKSVSFNIFILLRETKADKAERRLTAGQTALHTERWASGLSRLSAKELPRIGAVSSNLTLSAMGIGIPCVFLPLNYLTSPGSR